MPYIGNTVQNQGFTPAIDYFSGNGVTVTFTLSRPLVSVAQVICAIDNVIQNPSSAYTISGNQITFTSAPLAGTNNIWVEYTSLITTYNAISQSPSVIGDITASGGYLAVGSFGNTFIDGTIVDYVTGNGRITVGPADGFTIYNNGTSARYTLAAWDTSGNLTNTGNGSFQGVYIGRGGGAVDTNTAVGYQAANSNNVGSRITAVGYQAGYSTVTTGYCTYVGHQAGYTNTTGYSNVGVGYRSLYVATGGFNTAIGDGSAAAITTGTKNTLLGRYDGNTSDLDIRTSSNNIVVADGDGTARILLNGSGAFRLFNSNNYTSTSNTKGGTVTALPRDVFFPPSYFNVIDECTIIVNVTASEGTAGGYTRTDILHVNYRFGYAISNLANNVNDGIGITAWTYSFDSGGLKVTQNWSGGGSSLGTRWSFAIFGCIMQG